MLEGRLECSEKPPFGFVKKDPEFLHSTALALPSSSVSVASQYHSEAVLNIGQHVQTIHSRAWLGKCSVNEKAW